MENENKITLIDDNGKEIEFGIVATLEVNESEYAILEALDEGEKEEGVVIFKIVNLDGEEVLESIQNEEELNLVLQAYEELLDEN